VPTGLWRRTEGTSPEMTDLKVRKLPWEFDESVPFQWNRENPRFGIMMNAVSFLAPAFERFIVSSTRAAMAQITDPATLEEADAFLRQEAIHGRAHRNHTAALVKQYPGLKQVLVDLDASYDRVLKTEPLEYHLAYIADIEATFTPLFSVMLNHQDKLFDIGDHRVGPLFLWHFVEEIEHRSSAKIVYDAVVPSPWYRLRVIPKVVAHVMGCFSMFCRAVDTHVPAADRGIDACDMIVRPKRLTSLFERSELPGQFEGVPRTEVITMLYRLARAQAPNHSPATEKVPAFASEWFEAYEQGKDVVNWYRPARVAG